MALVPILLIYYYTSGTYLDWAVGLSLHAIVILVVLRLITSSAKLIYYPSTRELLDRRLITKQTIQLTDDCKIILRRTNEVFYYLKDRGDLADKDHVYMLMDLRDQYKKLIFHEIEINGYKALVPRTDLDEKVEKEARELLKEIKRLSMGVRRRIDTFFRIWVWCPEEEEPKEIYFADRFSDNPQPFAEQLAKDTGLDFIDHTGAVPQLIQDVDKSIKEGELKFSDEIALTKIEPKFSKTVFQPKNIIHILLPLPFIGLYFYSVEALWTDSPFFIRVFLIFFSPVVLVLIIGVIASLNDLVQSENVEIDFENKRVIFIKRKLLTWRKWKMPFEKIERIIPVFRDGTFFLEFVSDNLRIPFGDEESYTYLFEMQRALILKIRNSS